MGAAVAGAMTGLPGLVFGLVGAVAVALARLVGMTAGIAIGLTAAALGLLLRVTTGDATLFLIADAERPQPVDAPEGHEVTAPAVPLGFSVTLIA